MVDVVVGGGVYIEDNIMIYYKKQKPTVVVFPLYTSTKTGM